MAISLGWSGKGRSAGAARGVEVVRGDEGRVKRRAGVAGRLELLRLCLERRFGKEERAERARVRRDARRVASSLCEPEAVGWASSTLLVSDREKDEKEVKLLRRREAALLDRLP